MAPSKPSPTDKWIARLAAALALFATLGGLAAAVYRIVQGSHDERALVEAGFAAIGGIMCAVIVLLIAKFAANEPIFIESKWGSLGGGTTGWTVSQPLALLCIFAGCAVALLLLSYAASNTTTKRGENAEHRTQDLKLSLDTKSSSESSAKDEKK
jgi:hypothetical protein